MSKEGNKNADSALVGYSAANNSKKDLAISGFLPGLPLQLSEDCPAYPLHWGVQSAACRTPFHAAVMRGQVACFYCL